MTHTRLHAIVRTSHDGRIEVRPADPSMLQAVVDVRKARDAAWSRKLHTRTRDDAVRFFKSLEGV